VFVNGDHFSFKGFLHLIGLWFALGFIKNLNLLDKRRFWERKLLYPSSAVVT